MQPAWRDPSDRSSSLRTRLCAWFGLAVWLAASACAAPERDPLAIKQVPSEADTYLAAMHEQRVARIDRIVARAERLVDGRGEDATVDVLMISGGADWGAFGAGYLAQWQQLGDAAAFPMPEFDIIAGISTGALIATYIAGQTPERYAGIEDFYRNTSADWIQFHGLTRLLPSSTSILDTGKIRTEIEAALDPAIIADLRHAYADDRPVLAGTTNLDHGRLQYWDLGEVAAERPEPAPRLVDILMAATAIPGLFPPVIIDDRLFADGYAVQGIPAIDPQAAPILRAAWQARQGERPFPQIRLWWIYNNQLDIASEAVGLSWLDILYRSYQTMSLTAFRAPLEQSMIAAKSARARGVDAIELRWAAIPDDFVADPDIKPFDPEITNRLADLGRQVAASPDGGWHTDLPE